MLPSNISSFVVMCASIGQQAQCCTVPVVSFLPLLEAAWCDLNAANHVDAAGPSSDLLKPSRLSRHIHPVSWRTLASDRSVVAESQLLARIGNSAAAQDEKGSWSERSVFRFTKKRVHLWINFGVFC